MNDHTIETIGCDLGDKLSAIFLIRPDGRTELARVRTTRSAMEEFFRRPVAHVVIEVGNHSRWVSHLLQELGHRVTVANPRRVKAISEATRKPIARTPSFWRAWDEPTNNCSRRFSIEDDRCRPTSPC